MADRAFRCEHCGRIVSLKDKPNMRPGAFARLRYCSQACNGAARTLSAEDRFATKYIVAPNGCWEWTGYRSGGYGNFFDGARDTKAHRWSWEHANGEELGERVCRHKCDNPGCVNPDHLEPGTQAENLDDAKQRGRIPRGAARGSKLTEAHVRAIRAHPGPLSAIAAEFSIGQSTASNIRNRKRWGHVE